MTSSYQHASIEFLGDVGWSKFILLHLYGYVGCHSLITISDVHHQSFVMSILMVWFNAIMWSQHARIPGSWHITHAARSFKQDLTSCSNNTVLCISKGSDYMRSNQLGGQSSSCSGLGVTPSLLSCDNQWCSPSNIHDVNVNGAVQCNHVITGHSSSSVGIKTAEMTNKLIVALLKKYS